MEGLFQTLAQILFEIAFEVFAEIFSIVLENFGEISNYISEKTNQRIEISFSDEITKLNLFD